MRYKNVAISFFRFVTICEFVGQTDRRPEKPFENTVRCIACSRTVINEDYFITLFVT